MKQNKKISRTAPAKDTAPAATSGQSASTPTAERVQEGPAPVAAEAVKPQGSNAVGVTLQTGQQATVTATRQGGASWWIPPQRKSGFGSK